MERLDLKLDYRPASARLIVAGSMTLTLEADSSYGPTLWVNRRVPAVRFRSVNGVGAEVALNGSHPDRDAGLVADVRFPEVRRRGDRITLTFECTADRESSQLIFREALAYASWVERWYPAPLPRTKSERSGAAPGSTTLTIPATWSTVSNGVRESRRTSGGRTVERWTTDAPLMRSFVAGPYRTTSAETSVGKINVHARSDSVAAEAEKLSHELTRVIHVLEDRFGSFPYPSYSVVEVPEIEGWDASSEQGFLVSRSASLLNSHGRLPLLAHEISHAWWGNRVRGSGPGSILVSEGMAQYGAALAVEGLLSAEKATSLLRLPWEGYYPDQNAHGYFSFLRRGWDGPLAALETGDQGVSQLARAKGPWIFRMLRWELGDDRFFEVLRTVQDSFAGRAARLDDLRSAFESAAADSARLKDFFHQWLDRPGAPILGLQWSPVRTEQGGVEVVIRQWTDRPFDLKLAIGIESAGETIKHVVRLADPLKRFRLPADGQVESVTLDPENRLLLWTPEHGWPSALNGENP